MARTEGYREGVINTYTIRSDVDFAIEKAWTTTGIIGVKVWINRGENFGLELRRPSTTDKAIQTPGQTNSRGNNDNYHNRPRQYAPKGGEK
jgi:ribosomal protein S3